MASSFNDRAARAEDAARDSACELTTEDVEALNAIPWANQVRAKGQVASSGANPGPRFPTPSRSRTDATLARHERDPDADAVFIQHVGTAFRCTCGRLYVGGYGCPADKGADPPSARELEGWHRRAAERVVRTYADAPPELQAEARCTWPSLGDALDALARIDALAELADDADE